MNRSTKFVLMTLHTIALASSCATTPASSPTPAATTPTAAERLLAAAEAAQHCAGEEATDDARAAFLAECYASNRALARELLPQVTSSSLPPGAYAAAKLYVSDDLDEDTRGALCGELPAGDFMPSLLDDEVRAAICGTEP